MACQSAWASTAFHLASSCPNSSTVATWGGNLHHPRRPPTSFRLAAGCTNSSLLNSFSISA